MEEADLIIELKATSDKESLELGQLVGRFVDALGVGLNNVVVSAGAVARLDITGSVVMSFFDVNSSF